MVSCSSHTLGFGAPDVPLSATPAGVVRVDLNGDAVQDLAVLNSGGTVTVLLGFGDGTFATPQSYTLAGAPSGAAQGIAAADLDGDGHPDVAVVETSGRVQILAGSSSGTLTVKTPITLTGFPMTAGLIAADFNGDGKGDLAVFEKSTGQIAVLTSQGGFTFAESDQSLLSGTPVGIAAADVDGDGRVDIVAALGTPKEVVTILNKAAGFSPVAPVTLPQTPTALGVADLDGDGKPDAVAGCADGSVQVLLGSGTGSFGAPASPGNAGGSISEIGIGDITGDGHADIAALTTAAVTVLPSTGAGAWGSAASFIPGAASAMVVGELNGDAHADVAIGADTSLDVSVLLAAPVTILTGPTLVRTTQIFSGTVLADLNGDGHLDGIAVSTATDEVGVFLNNGNGSFAPVVTYGVGSGAQPAEVAVADFNKDGRLDLAVASPGLGTLSVLLGTAGGFGPVRQVTAGNASGVVAGDFNNDGSPDLIGYGFGGLTVLPGMGNGTFGAAIAQTGTPNAIARLAVAKVNKDQTLDLVGVTSPFESFEYVANAITLLGNGDGTFGGGSTTSLISLGGNPARGAFAAAGDFNNDGNTDLVAYADSYSSQGYLALLTGDGTGTLTSKQSLFGDAAGIAAGDFDGDGNLDVVEATTASPSGISLFRGNGTGTLTQAFFRTATLPLKSLAAGDLSGDGRPSLFFGVAPGTGELLNLCK